VALQYAGLFCCVKKGTICENCNKKVTEKQYLKAIVLVRDYNMYYGKD